MIEAMMYLAIGFLAASLLALAIFPLVHGRAVRLTMHRMEAAIPHSAAEVEAERDHLRAEFAVATRRLEISLEQLKAKTASQLADLGKKGEAIARLRSEIAAKIAALHAAEERERALQEQLRAAEEDFLRRRDAFDEAERRLADKEAELARLAADIDRREVASDSQRIELVALQTQLEALKNRLSEWERAARDAEMRLAQERLEMEAADRELAAARSKNFALESRLQELETRLAEQEGLGAGGERARLQVSKSEGDSRAEAPPDATGEARENAVLRERISDVAAEIARLTAAMEGANSPINRMLAEEIQNRAPTGDREAAKPGSPSQVSGAGEGRGLADRIRALRNRASGTTDG